MRDIVSVGHCPSGTRVWFEDRDLDFRGFLKNGIPASVLWDTGDGLARQVVGRLREKKENG
tara:strand:- start:5311 stop:5493 length:183 start_codon:yes stop_codon:yes gene_type:complete